MSKFFTTQILIVLLIFTHIGQTWASTSLPCENMANDMSHDVMGTSAMKHSIMQNEPLDHMTHMNHMAHSADMSHKSGMSHTSSMHQASMTSDCCEIECSCPTSACMFNLAVTDKSPFEISITANEKIAIPGNLAIETILSSLYRPPIFA